MIEDIKKEIDKKYKEYDKSINEQNRCKWSRENETVEVSKSRRSGFLSGLLVSKSIVEKYKGIDKYKNAWEEFKNIVAYDDGESTETYGEMCSDVINELEQKHNISKEME